MEKILSIKSRYNQERVLEFISENQIKISGESEWMRCGYDDTISTKENIFITFVDFEGGPAFSVGHKLNLGDFGGDSNDFYEILSISREEDSTIPSYILEVRKVRSNDI